MHTQWAGPRLKASVSRSSLCFTVFYVHRPPFHVFCGGLMCASQVPSAYIYQVQVFRSRDFARLQSAFPGLSQYSLAEPRLLGEDLENYLRATCSHYRNSCKANQIAGTSHNLIAHVYTLSPSLIKTSIARNPPLFEIFSLMRVECIVQPIQGAGYTST